MFKHVVKNEFGFYELKQKPTPDELNNYYSLKYYQESKGSYQKQYCDEEVQYLNNKIEQKYSVISTIISFPKPNPRFLDIGCGEGWALNYFKKMGWEICGIDYSNFGCDIHNPNCLPHLKIGDIYETLDRLIEEKQTFEVLWLDNILEHVLAPYDLLMICKKLVCDDGVMVVEVPNDFSPVQMYLYDKQKIPSPFWIANPDHISYFNKQGLETLSNAAGWDCKYVLGDFPIDLNLFNPDTNYILDKSKGKNSHLSRVEIENLIHSISINKANELYRALGEIGLGRQIIGFYQRKEG